MKSLSVVLLSVALLVSGCTRTALVRLETGPDARLESVTIFRSSGNPEHDAIALRAARTAFSKRVPRPLKNHKYTQPVAVGAVPPEVK
jgi:hypothetical protein